MATKFKKGITYLIDTVNDKITTKLCYRSGFMASLYYLFFSKAFYREHKAVLSGKVRHLNEKNNAYLLVRNTHRLEKGLLMRPRKEIFGKAYIGETVETFLEIHKNNLGPDKQLKWSHDVLQTYFGAITVDEETEPLKKKFETVSTENPTENEEKRAIPYRRKMEEFSDISYDKFYKLTRQRRSVRWFKDKKVPRELLDKAILAAGQSPSACNRQPFEYRIIDDPKYIAKAVNLPMGTKGYGHALPVFIVVVGNLDAYFSERDRHLIYVDSSLANMALMLALETLGLSSCPINWPDIELREKKMQQFLNLKNHQRPIMCIGVGYPDEKGMVGHSEKRDLNNLRKYNL